MLIGPIQGDPMNMTKKVELDQKIHTNEHLPSNLTENIINITTTTNLNVLLYSMQLK